MPDRPARPPLDVSRDAAGDLRVVGAVRPSWRTVRRPRLDGPVAAIAAVAGRCPLCPETVDVDDEVALLGAALIPEHAATPASAAAVVGHRVDLADAEWAHMRCALADRYGDDEEVAP